MSRIRAIDILPPEALPRCPGAEVIVCRGAPCCPLRLGYGSCDCLRVTASDYDASAERPASSA